MIFFLQENEEIGEWYFVAISPIDMESLPRIIPESDWSISATSKESFQIFIPMSKRIATIKASTPLRQHRRKKLPVEMLLSSHIDDRQIPSLKIRLNDFCLPKNMMLMG